jgi:hypothetical protein
VIHNRNECDSGKAFWRHLRQSSIESCNADFQTPKNGGVQRPADDLDFGAHHTVVVFVGVDVEVCTFLGCHVAVCETSIFGADQVRCHDFSSEKQLLNAGVSILEHANNVCVGPVDRPGSGTTYTSQWHQIIINLPVGRPHASPSEVDSNNDGEQANGEKGERLCGRHVVNGETARRRDGATTANGAAKLSLAQNGGVILRAKKEEVA